MSINFKWTFSLMSNSSISVVEPSSQPRRRYTVQFKRQVVQESMARGASIARVALTHGLNANQLHNWRWQYRRGDFRPVSQDATLVPIHINALPTGRQAEHYASTGRGVEADAVDTTGRIELHLGHVKIVVHGAADPRALQCMIELLRT